MLSKTKKVSKKKPVPKPTLLIHTEDNVLFIDEIKVPDNWSPKPNSLGKMFDDADVVAKTEGSLFVRINVKGIRNKAIALQHKFKVVGKIAAKPTIYLMKRTLNFEPRAEKPVDPKYRTPSQLIEAITKDLQQLIKRAVDISEIGQEVVGAERASKILARRKVNGKYSLNPHRFHRLIPDEITGPGLGRLVKEALKDRPDLVVHKTDEEDVKESKKRRKKILAGNMAKELKVQAKVIAKQLTGDAEGLFSDRRLMLSNQHEVTRMADLVVHHLRDMEKGLENLEKWKGVIQNRSKVLRLHRRKEIALSEKIFGHSPAEPTSKKSTRADKGDSEMAKKKVSKKKGTKKAAPKGNVKELIAKLAKTKDPTEKRKIRQQLRKLGHTGGLGQGAGRPKKTSKKKTSKKKTSKKAKKTSKKKVSKKAKKAKGKKKYSKKAKK